MKLLKLLLNKHQTNINPLFLSFSRCLSSWAYVKTAEINDPFDGLQDFEAFSFHQEFKRLNEHTLHNSIERFRHKPRRLKVHNLVDSNILGGFKQKLRSLNKRNLPNLGSFGIRIRSNGVLDRKQLLKWFSWVLEKCASGKSVKEGKAVHGQIIRSGLVLDSHVWVSLINFYAKCRSLACACWVFDEMPKNERDIVSWTTLISGFVSEGYGFDAVILFCQMQKEGIRPNGFTLSSVLKACAGQEGMEFGRQLHAEVVKGGVLIDMFVGSAAVDFYAKCGDMENAAKVFYSMPMQNAVLWNALLHGYAQIGGVEEIMRLFCSMNDTEMKFNKFTLCNVLKGCTESGNLGSGQLLHAVAIKVGHDTQEFLSCSLVDFYSKCGLVDDAGKLFSRIKCPDIATWNAMISCLAQQGSNVEATKLFCSMKCAGLTPNQFTLTSLVSAATDLGTPM